MSSDNTFRTITSTAEGVFKDRGSKFFAYAFPVQSENRIKDIIKDIRKKYHDARHHCYAYRLGELGDVYRINDDGEPSGTAGRPIYGQLLSNNLTNILIIVVRYFGGTLLGTGGLVKAYTESTQMVVNVAERGKRTPVHVAMVALPYNLLERIRLVVGRNNGEVLGEDFGGDVTMTLQFPVDSYDGFQQELQELSAGKLKAEVIETKETIVKISVGE